MKSGLGELGHRDFGGVRERWGSGEAASPSLPKIAKFPVTRACRGEISIYVIGTQGRIYRGSVL